MDEHIFFNYGNALTSDVDLKALYVAAQIEKDKNNLQRELIIVEDPETAKFLLFSKDDFEKLENKDSYKIIDRMK